MKDVEAVLVLELKVGLEFGEGEAVTMKAIRESAIQGLREESDAALRLRLEEALPSMAVSIGAVSKT